MFCGDCKEYPDRIAEVLDSQYGPVVSLGNEPFAHDPPLRTRHDVSTGIALGGGYLNFRTVRLDANRLREPLRRVERTVKGVDQ